MSLQELRAGLVARHESELRQVDAVIAMAQGLTTGAALVLPGSDRKLPPSTPLHWRRQSPIDKGTKRTPKTQTTKETTGARKGTLAARIHELLASKPTLLKTFTADDLERALNDSSVSRKKLQDCLVWQVRGGKLEVVSRQPTTYQLKGARKMPVFETKSKAQLEEELGEAMRQRDEAVATGRNSDRVTAQRKIDDLEEQIEKLEK